MCFRSMIVRPSGPAARELLLFRMAWVTYEGWNCVLAASPGRVLIIYTPPDAAGVGVGGVGDDVGRW